jgi:ABC-type lipoprotein release transport system permease subunit
MNASYEAQILALGNVSAITPRIESYALASFDDISKGCLTIGISPKDEDKITSLSSKLVSGQYFAANERNTVLLSEGLAERLNINVNDTLYLISQGYHGSLAAGKYTVKGIVRFGAPDLNHQLLFMPLSTAQEFYSAPNLITSYVIGLFSDSELEVTMKKIRGLSSENYEVMSWKDLMPDVDQHIQMDKAGMYIILGILYLLICFGIFGTLIMMMIERRYEMGMLVAIGMKKSKLVLIVVLESILTVLIGSVIGLICSVPIVYYLKEHPIRIGGEIAEAFRQFNFEPVFPASVDPSIFIAQGLIVISIGLGLSIYPVIKVIRLDPVKAMKK